MNRAPTPDANMIGLIKKIVGTKNERDIKRIRPVVDQINSFEPQYEKLTNAELRAKIAPCGSHQGPKGLHRKASSAQSVADEEARREGMTPRVGG